MSSLAEQISGDNNVATASFPVPPRSVAETASISQNRTTDLIAIVRTQSEPRTTKSGEQVADVELVDASTMPDGKLATIKVAVFGESKLQLIKRTGGPLVFLNLAVKCNGKARDINHWMDDEVIVAQTSEKSQILQAQSATLLGETNIHTITTEWTPSHQKKDVSGEQPLSCCAFLDFAAESPNAKLPGVAQINWAHVEEPQSRTDVLDKSGSRIWFLADVRDASGAISVGVPERIALQLAHCRDKEEFTKMHAAGLVKFPLFCNLRISRDVKPSGATLSQSSSESSSPSYISHVIEDAEPVDWTPASAPNAAYSKILEVLSLCPPHDGGIVFSALREAHPSAHYNFEVRFHGEASESAKGRKVAALVGVTNRSSQENLGSGCKVVTEGVVDLLGDALQLPEGQYPFNLVGYCQLDDILDFKLAPPRGHRVGCAVVLLSEIKDEDGVRTLQLDKVEAIDPSQKENAIASFTRLRRSCMGLHPVEDMKRTRSLGHIIGDGPGETKRCKTLARAPTDAELP